MAGKTAKAPATKVKTAAKASKTSKPTNADVKSYGTGRRKNSTVRVWIAPGNGKITVNDRDIATYFGRPVLQMIIQQPFHIISAAGQYDIWCTAKGGGLSGQAYAIRLGVARALVELDETLRPALRQAGFLTRDSRVVERKKYGRAKARRSFQFSKR